MNNKDYMIEVSDLCKDFGQVRAVDHLSFRVKKGELFAFLGVNGAGKSTSISMICGQLRPSAGDIRVNAIHVKDNPFAIKEQIGVVFQDSVLDKPLTVRQNLASRAALYGITGKSFEKRLQELSDILSLSEFMDRPLGKLSGGQRRRVDIARALLHKPRLLILDEPTTGLDPQTRKSIWSIIDQLRKEDGLTVFLTTHYMEEAACADYVVIIDHGRILAEGTPYELKNQYVQDSLYLYHVTQAEVERLGLTATPIRDGYKIAIESPKKATELILAHTNIFRDYEIVKGGMDDVFLSVTGRTLEGGMEE